MPQTVVANQDFRYDDTLYVRKGQVFALRGHRNDGGLLKHNLVAAVKITAAERKRLPRSAGQSFMHAWQRDRAAAEDEKSPQEQRQGRQEQIDRRIIHVGA